MPQCDSSGFRSDEDSAIFGRAVLVMTALYASPLSTSVCRLAHIPVAPEGTTYKDTPIDERGWCIFEEYAAYIVVGTDSFKSQEEASSLRPKLLE